MPSSDPLKEIFSGIDYGASIRLVDNTLWLEFKFPDAAAAEELHDKLLAAHAAGEAVTIVLQNPDFVEPLQ